MIANNTNFVVLDETQDYIVVDKPSPLLVHPSVPGNPPTLLDGIKSLLAYEIANGASLSIINRLDRETSGVVLIAKNKINTCFQILGIPDEYMINGSQSDVLDHYNMSPEKITKTVTDLLLINK